MAWLSILLHDMWHTHMKMNIMIVFSLYYDSMCNYFGSIISHSYTRAVIIFLEMQLSYKDSSYIYAVTAVSTAILTFWVIFLWQTTTKVVSHPTRITQPHDIGFFLLLLLNKFYEWFSTISHNRGFVQPDKCCTSLYAGWPLVWKCQGIWNMSEKILSWKSVPKLFITNWIFAFIWVFIYIN